MLKKALYTEKQAPYPWYSRIDEYLLNLCFTKTFTDPNLYSLFHKLDTLVLVMYVDVLILKGGNEKLIAWCKWELASKFDTKDINLMHYFWGVEIWKGIGEVFLVKGGTQWRFSRDFI
jgi:hypothetical protein